MNKKIAWTVFLAALAGVGVWAYTKINKLLKEYELTYFKYANFTANWWNVAFGTSKTLTGSFDFIIDNQGNLDMEMKKLKLTVYVGGEKAANITSVTNVLIKPKSVTTQKLAFSTPSAFVKPLLGVLASNYSNVKDLPVKYKGTMWVKIGVGDITVPLPFTDEYKLGELM
jgi:LEA14-like dessication related protein